MSSSSLTGNSGGGGWITTKKRGRDDDQIERDRLRAVQQRKQQRWQRHQHRPKNGALKGCGGNKKKPAAGRRNQYDSDEDDDEASLGSFIVDDDDDDVEDEDEGSSGDGGNDSDSDDDDDIISVHSSPDDHRQRHRKQPQPQPRPMTKHKLTTTTSTSTLPTHSRHFDRRGRSPTAAQAQDGSSSSDGDDDDDDDSLLLPFGVGRPPVTKKRLPPPPAAGAAASTKMPPRSKSNAESFTSPAFTATGTAVAAPARRPKAATAWASAFDDSDSDDEVERAIQASLREQERRKQQPQQIRKESGNFDGDADDDRDFGFGSPTPAKESTKKKRRLHKHKKKKGAFDDDAFDDEAGIDKAERDALKWALKASLKEQQRREDKKKKKVKKLEVSSSGTAVAAKKKTSSSRAATVLDTDDDDENEHEANTRGTGGVIHLDSDVDVDDDVKDVAYYYDETEVAVQSVLDTTNRLSAQVLAVMTQWLRGDDKDGDNSSNGTTGEPRRPPIGMIVDGALALGSGCHAAAKDGASPSTSSSSWIPSSLLRQVCPNVTLAEYQLVGVNWLALLHNLTCHIDGKSTHVNGVLADEMGLGKTVQTIVFLRYLKHVAENQDEGGGPPRPHLVIVPSSVLSNWERELETFAPDLHVVKFHGTLEERESLQYTIHESLTRPSRDSTSRVDVILAPVTYFQKENAAERKFLNKFEYEYLVVDEAHVLKNASGNRYKSLNRMRSKHRLLLTGTPVQNSPSELLTLLSFLMPKLFANGALDSDNHDDGDAADSLFRHFVTVEGRSGIPNPAACAKLKQLLAPFVLRRKKVDVLRQLLPPKLRQVEFVDLEPSARDVYNSIIEEHLANKKTKSNGSLTNSTSTGHLFTQLRKASHHPLLLRTRYRSPAEKAHLAKCFHQYGAFRGEGCTRERVAKELEGMSDFDIHLTALELLEANRIGRSQDLERYVLSEDDLFASAKFQRLRTLLPSLVKDGHRILLFSVWTNCLDLLSCLMESLGLEYLRMEGSTPVNQRQELMDEFNNNPDIPVFLLSTKACGLGINLTSADVCIMHDLDFNPFNDLQAEDRCHRIGQKRVVTVYKLVSRSTVDEDIYRMQERKSEMNAAIMETSTGDGTSTTATSSTSSSSKNDSNSSSKFDSAKETQAVLRDAVDRYLRSPAKSRATSSTAAAPSPAAATATKHEKENGHENEVIELDFDDDDTDADGDDATATSTTGGTKHKKPAAAASVHDDEVITIDSD